MYLKRLDMQGFKSFANKTSVEFATGVTCIVGPNGCGKTNVADSLRWVLGEHARQALRARKTEDVIFAGSEKRAPVGVAEVNITLDNTEQWLPVDFNEVTVTRRAYRDGENEYFINGSRVRLRDVVELFMRAQVGQNSYAFMGQGMVEQVLSLRPEDRRALIEEAAEVRLYRTRLEEAQSKLKGTRENLERVQLLVREIQPRITQLERQAGRAIKYQELARELAGLLHVWYEHQWREVNASVLAALASHDQRSEEYGHVQAEVKACEDGLVQLRAAIDERRHEISARESRLANLQDYARDLERRAALDDERARLLAQRVQDLLAEIASLREDLEAQEATSQPLPDSALREEALATERAALAALRERLAAIDDDLITQQRAVLEEEQRGARAREDAARISRQLGEARNAVARLQRDAATASERRAQLVRELAAWAREFAVARADAARLAHELTSKLADHQHTLANAQRLTLEHASVERELQALRSELDTAKARLELIETLDVSAQPPDAAAHVVLEAGGILKRETLPADIELSGVLNQIGNILRMPRELETAVFAALGETVFAIVMQRESDVRAALALLMSREDGRVTMYALDSLQEVRPLHLMKERGVVGVASQLVRCEHRYRRLIDTLLGRTIVVEDYATAQRWMRRGLGSAVVTLDGILLRPVGSVAVGSLTAIEATFTREREATDLPQEIEQLTAAIDEKESVLADIAQSRDEASALAGRFDREIETLREASTRARVALPSTQSALEVKRAEIAAVTAASGDAAVELSTLADSIAALESERTTTNQLAAEAAGGEHAAREALVALESERASLLAAADEQASKVAFLDGELKSERHAGEGDRVALERLERQITQKTDQHENLRAEQHDIASRLAATRRELAEKTADVTALQSELEPARSELSQLESRERSLTADLADAGARLRTAERARFDAEADVRTRRDELESIRQSIEVDGFIARDDGEVERAPQPEPELAEADGAVEAFATGNGDLPGWLREDGDGSLPVIRGGSTINPTEVRDRIADLRAQIRSLGPVNEQAATDYEESRGRYDFLTGQLADLNDAEAQLHEAIKELEAVIRDKFRTTFKTVNREFERYFSAFFRGGTAYLELGETDDEGLPGIEIIAQPPGKKLGSLNLLSGGERSLTAVALLFALLQANPSPICVLDEVDAALDEANVGRFVEELRELSQRTQFIIITHNRRTIENADTLYGVSMGADSVSRVLSVRLADIEADLD